MKQDIAPISNRQLARSGFDRLPAVVARAGERAAWRFLEFFTANIRNKNTRAAYAQACSRFFDWCDERGLELSQLQPVIVASYIESLQNSLAAPSVKQHLAAIRMLFDWLILGQVIPMNPAAAVRGPKHVVKKGKTPVLEVGRSQAAARLDRYRDHRGPPRSRLTRRDVLHLRPRQRRRSHESRRLLPDRQALVVPSARERRQAPRSARPPQRRGLPRRLYRRGRHMGGERKARSFAVWTSTDG